MNNMNRHPSVATDYMSLANHAATLEHQEEWGPAAKAWGIAMVIATKGENRAWADARQKRCEFRVENPYPTLERTKKTSKATSLHHQH